VTSGSTANPRPSNRRYDHDQDHRTRRSPRQPHRICPEEKTTKSIVPAGWKSKNDDLAKFIDNQCSGKEGFEYPAFFSICRKNGIDEAKVKHYEELVASKAHGSQGRAKMTLRNMLATIARKNGKLVGLNDEEVAIDLPKPALGGAAAKAAEAKATETAEVQESVTETATEASPEVDGEVTEDATTE
jgi:fructose-specific component phosphotransferase system IIB-like protein